VRLCTRVEGASAASGSLLTCYMVTWCPLRPPAPCVPLASAAGPDLDCLFTPATGGGGQADGARHARLGVNLTLAGLLNALDGLASGPSGRITVLTSNHPKLLDSALLRPGRVDVTAAFQHPERQELVALFRSFYPAVADEKDAEGFADAVLGGNFAKATRSVATLQQLFIKHRTQLAKTVVEDVVLFLEKVEKGASATGSDGGRTRALPI